MWSHCDSVSPQTSYVCFLNVVVIMCLRSGSVFFTVVLCVVQFYEVLLSIFTVVLFVVKLKGKPLINMGPTKLFSITV